MFRNLIEILNEAFAPVHVESSHIDTVEHNGDKLYVRFLDGALYEYDDVSEEDAREMLRAPSKGRYMWQNIRTTKPYRRVTSVPTADGSEPPQMNVAMTYDDESDSFVDAQAPQDVDISDVEVPIGYQFRAPDSDNYIWKGAAWVNTRTGRIATRAIRDKITEIAKHLIKIKGEA